MEKFPVKSGKCGILRHNNKFRLLCQELSKEHCSSNLAHPTVICIYLGLDPSSCLANLDNTMSTNILVEGNCIPVLF